MTEVLAVVFTGLGVFVSIVIYILQRRRKDLLFRIIADARLIDTKHGEIQVLFSGTQIEHPHLVFVEVLNSGNQAIKSDEYELPIKFLLNKEATVLSVDVYNTEPSGIMVKVTNDETSFSFMPLLLNAKDSITFKVIVDNFKTINCEGRIIDVKKIRRGTSEEVIRLRKTLKLMSFARSGYLLIGGVLVLSILHTRVGPFSHREIILTLSLLLLLSSLQYIVLYFGAKRRIAANTDKEGTNL